MTFEIHMRELFEGPEPPAAPGEQQPEKESAPDRRVWRIASVIVVTGILIGLGILFIGRPADSAAASSAQGGRSSETVLAAGQDAAPQVSGADFRKLDRSGETPPRPDAVVVASVAADSPAARHGLREGDVIVAANREPVHSIEDLARIAANVEGVLMLDILRADEPVVVRAH